VKRTLLLLRIRTKEAKDFVQDTIGRCPDTSRTAENSIESAESWSKTIVEKGDSHFLAVMSRNETEFEHRNRFVPSREMRNIERHTGGSLDGELSPAANAFSQRTVSVNFLGVFSMKKFKFIEVRAIAVSTTRVRDPWSWYPSCDHFLMPSAREAPQPRITFSIPSQSTR
jgi:hypothetical protein